MVNQNIIQAFNLPIDAPGKQSYLLGTQYVNYQDLSDLIVAVLGVNIDIDTNFTSPMLIRGLLEPTIIAGVSKLFLYYIY